MSGWRQVRTAADQGPFGVAVPVTQQEMPMATRTLGTRVAVSGAVALVVTAGVAVCSAAAPTAYSRPGATERVSVTSSNHQAEYPPLGCSSPYSTADSDVSADGRYVVFAVASTNMVPVAAGAPVGNPVCQVYWRDRVARITKLVSLGLDGVPAAGQSGMPSISADGRYVAFDSQAPNLVPGDTNLAMDVFVRDMRTNETVRASVSSSGTQLGKAGNTVITSGSKWPTISSNGRRVAFLSDASNAVLGDTNNADDVFVRDLATKKTIRVSVTSKGEQVQGNAGLASISGNGRYVAFESNAAGLTPDGPATTGSATGIYRHDLVTGQTVLASVSSSGARAETLGQASGSSLSNYGGRTISDDGRFIVFWTAAANLVPNDSNYVPLLKGSDIFVRDLQARRTERVSVGSTGQQFLDPAETPSISGDGRFVEYSHYYSGPQDCPAWSLLGLVPMPAGVSGVTCGTEAIVYDRLAGSMEVISRPAAGAPSRQGKCSSTDTGPALLGFAGALSRNGKIATFYSSDAGLVAGDTNDSCDYFARDRGTPLGANIYVGSTLVPTSSASAEACVLNICPLHGQADLLASRVIARPASGDMFVRWDVRDLTVGSFSSTTSALFGLEFTSKDVRYQVRVQRGPGTDVDRIGGASFGLFRESLPGVWTHVAALKGGYGTIGDSVVTAVPLSLLGGKAQLTDVTAYTAVGSYLSGPTKVLDSLRLTSRSTGVR